MPKLKKVKFDGNINDTVPWLKNEVPTVSDSLLRKHKYSDRMEIFQSDVTGYACYDDGTMVVAKVKVGYAFNGADVPRFAEWFIPSDSYAMKAGSYFHDIAFNLQKLGQVASADVLADVAEFEGLHRFKARIVRRAVKGKIAGRLYRERDEFDLENSEYCSIYVGRWQD